MCILGLERDRSPGSQVYDFSCPRSQGLICGTSVCVSPNLAGVSSLYPARSGIGTPAIFPTRWRKPKYITRKNIPRAESRLTALHSEVGPVHASNDY